VIIGNRCLKICNKGGIMAHTQYQIYICELIDEIACDETNYQRINMLLLESLDLDTLIIDLSHLPEKTISQLLQKNNMKSARKIE